MLTPAHLELFVEVKADSFRRAGLTPESSVIFCELVELAMGEMSEEERRALILHACGYSLNDIARDAGVSRRTMDRRMAAINAKAFGELIACLAAMGVRMRGIRGKNEGTRLGRPPGNKTRSIERFA